MENLEDLTKDEALEVIQNLQRYIDDSLHRRDSFYDNLLLMKTESDENLKKLKKEFNERMTEKNEEDCDEIIEDEEEEDENSNDNAETLEEISDAEDQGVENVREFGPQNAFITEVDLKYEESSPTITYEQTPVANVERILELEKELLETRKEMKTLKKKYELARVGRQFGNVQGKERSEDQKKIDEIVELETQIENMKEKEKEMFNQMEIMKNAINEYKSKYHSKCKEVEQLTAESKFYKAGNVETKLNEELDRCRGREDELQKEIVALEGRIQDKSGIIEQLQKQLRTARNERDTQKFNYEDCVAVLADLQDQVLKLEENKRVTNERMRQLGGAVRISVSTQTCVETATVATNTENSIYNVSGRSLKREEEATAPFIFPAQYFRKINNSDLNENYLPSYTSSAMDLDPSIEKMLSQDHEDVKDAKAMDEVLDTVEELEVLENANFYDSIDEAGLEQALDVEIKNTTCKEKPIKLPQISSSDPVTSHTSKLHNASLKVKLPNISSPVGKADIGIRDGRRESFDGFRGSRRVRHRMEQIPSKIDVHIKEGDGSQWKPIANEDLGLSSQKCLSSALELLADTGKGSYGAGGTKKEAETANGRRSSGGQIKKEFMLSARNPDQRH